MGTRNNPGRFDCYNKAEPDEPVFVLLGRDPAAGPLVALWADIREKLGTTEPEMLEEARACARALRSWAGSHGKEDQVERVIRMLLEEYTRAGGPWRR